MSDEVGEHLSRNDDKVSVKETEQELLLRALKILASGSQDSSTWTDLQWKTYVQHQVGPMVASHHNLRDAMKVPDVVKFYLNLLQTEHYNGSKVISGIFAKEALMSVHGQVNQFGYI